MKTAIIGLGNIGSRLAVNLARGGATFIVADKTLAKAEKVSQELGSTVTFMTVPEAVRNADVVIMAIYFDSIKEFLMQYRRDLDGKIVVDPSNPIGPDGKGGFVKTIPSDQSSGELIAALLPKGAELVKAFGTLTAASLESGANRKPEAAVLFYATDYAEAATVVAKLIAQSGFSPVSVGGIQQSIRIEVGGDLHEMGKLGRLISASEAASLI